MRIIFDFFEKRLEKKLSKLQVQDLLVQMTNNQYYFPFNIWKSIFDRNSILGGKQISWFAKRQAENLKSIEDYEYLRKSALNSDNKQKRQSYFCIGNLSKNLKSKEMFHFLMNRLTIEEDEDVKTTILTAVTKIEKDVDYKLDAIFDILEYGNINLKTSAAIALQNSRNQLVEDKLLESLEYEKNKQLHKMIAATLRDIGTSKSIPTLKNKLRSGKGNDYKYFIENAIMEINKRNKYCG